MEQKVYEDYSIKIYEIYKFEGKNNNTEDVRNDMSVFISMF